MYHSYNLMGVEGTRTGRCVACTGHARGPGGDPQLRPPLADEAVDLLTPGRARLYREDQHSYVLYPERDSRGSTRTTSCPARRGGIGAASRKLTRRDRLHRGDRRHRRGPFRPGSRNRRQLNEVLTTDSDDRDASLAPLVARKGGA